MSFQYGQWHQHSVLIRPDTCKLDPEGKRVVVAILKHAKSPANHNLQDDYLWINCKPKTGIQQLLTVYGEKNPSIGAIVLCHEGKPCDSTLKIQDYVKDSVNGALTLQAMLMADWRKLMELTGSFKILRSSPNMTSHTPHLNSGRDPLQALSPNIRQSELSSTGKGIISPASQDRLIKRELAVEHANSMHLIPNPRSPTMARDVVAPSIVSTPSADQVMSKQSASDTVAHSNYPQWGGSPLPLTQSLSGQGSLNAPQTQSAANNLNSSADVRSSSLSTDSRSPLASKHNLLDDSATVTATGNIGELPSKRIPNQNVNRPFLGYIDYYYESSPSVRSLPLAALVDMAWTKWKALPEKSKEKEFFLRPVQSWIRNADGDELLREENHRALEDVKPEVPIDGSSQHDQSVPILDFQDDFGPIDNTNSQTITKSPEFKVQDLMAGASLEQLETFVARAVKWLDCLRNPLQKHGDESTDATQWLTAIDRIKGYAARTKTVIGVVGNTGAGKSSVINAMLDEEQLLPTNTMRACTAVVTEISYNHEEGRNYRAEVEFIDEASWHAELKILFSDLVDEDGKVVRDCGAPDSDAGIAYAKIKAVYPKKTKEDIGNSSISSMLKEVSHILGKTQKIQHDDSLLFYRQLQRYIDSQEKVTAKMTPEEKKKPREMEFWPLIKVVRIHCRSQALATGATIVDLPGVHDANAARAAVAEGYMKQCSGLWIVAPIIRAVDDKAAKNLLGQTFKRQLKMDGGFGQVSFICSKTDDISLMEATASLGLEETNGPLWEEADQQIPLRADLETNIKECNDKREGLGVLLDTLDSQVEVWEQLQKDFDEDGKPVYAPASKKRKSRKQFTVSRKKQNRSGAEDDDFIDDGSEVEQESDNEYASDKNEDNDDEEVSIRKPLTSDKISEQLTSFREQRKATRKQRAALNNDIKDLKEEINLSKETEKRVKAVIAQACIKGRNGYSKQAIQQDFAAGIRELDQENAQEEDAENFNPEEDIRDYDEIAKSLPVFCVSSRGYQQLQDRRKKDAPVTGFDNVEQTEIPALQEHCKQLTVSGRTQACKKFLVAIGTLANSLALWASSDGTNNHLTPEQREKEHKLLSKSLQNLDNALERLIETITRDLSKEVVNNLYEKYDKACDQAGTEATAICSRWGTRPNIENRSAGGYVWSTYKAVCRRIGMYTNAHGPIDFNGQLSEPMMVHLVPGWERLFARRVPAILSSLSSNLKSLLKTFHNDVAKRSQLSGIGIAALPMLEQQLENYVHNFEEASRTAGHKINEKQKEINRQFVPYITNIMEPAYVGCVEERGIGSFKRMQSLMLDHVMRCRNAMFKDSCAAVKRELDKVLREARDDLNTAADMVSDEISRDYRSTFSGKDLRPGQALPRWHREMRKGVLDVLRNMQEYLTSDTRSSNGDDDNAAAMQLRMEYTTIKTEDKDEEMRSDSDATDINNDPRSKVKQESGEEK